MDRTAGIKEKKRKVAQEGKKDQKEIHGRTRVNPGSRGE